MASFFGFWTSLLFAPSRELELIFFFFEVFIKESLLPAPSYLGPFSGPASSPRARRQSMRPEKEQENKAIQIRDRDLYAILFRVFLKFSLSFHDRVYFDQVIVSKRCKSFKGVGEKNMRNIEILFSKYRGTNGFELGFLSLA